VGVATHFWFYVFPEPNRFLCGSSWWGWLYTTNLQLLLNLGKNDLVERSLKQANTIQSIILFHILKVFRCWLIILFLYFFFISVWTSIMGCQVFFCTVQTSLLLGKYTWNVQVDNCFLFMSSYQRPYEHKSETTINIWLTWLFGVSLKIISSLPLYNLSQNGLQFKPATLYIQVYFNNSL
jgi:hypothetical protein